MGDIRRTINADKAGILAHLTEDREYRLERAQSATTQKEKRYQYGVAEGLWMAIHLIEDWVEADAIGGES